MIYIHNTYLKGGVKRNKLLTQIVISTVSLLLVSVLLVISIRQIIDICNIVYLLLASLAISVMLLYRPNKRLIFNDSGLLLLDNRNRLEAHFYPWDNIVKIEYKAKFLSYTNSVWSYELMVTYKNKDARDNHRHTIIIDLYDYLSEIELLMIRVLIEKNNSSVINKTRKLFYLNNVFREIKNKHPKIVYTYDIKWF